MADLLWLLFVAFWGWVVIEVMRRAALQVWRERKARQFGATIPQYAKWKRDLRDRNG